MISLLWCQVQVVTQYGVEPVGQVQLEYVTVLGFLICK